MYRWFYDLVVVRVDAELAHRLAVAGFRFGWPLVGLARAIGLLARPRPESAVEAFGVRFPAPMGLAAGMDKNAEAVLGLLRAGFSHVEVGTVTPLAQPGNDKPRSWRELDVRGIRNRMGFNNEGAEAMARRLAWLRSSRRGREAVIGVNIGKNKVTSAADAASDYFSCAQSLAAYADYLVVNVSSPNTPGLRDLQGVEALRPILEAARAGADEGSPERRVPLLVKIAPDLADEDVDAAVDLAVELGLDGIVATNTTIAHDRGPGGLSGAPLFPRAIEVVRRVVDRAAGRLAVIGVGGIDSLEDAQAMLDTGVDLIQCYTGFVYNGPGWVSRVNRELVVPARADA